MIALAAALLVDLPEPAAAFVTGRITGTISLPDGVSIRPGNERVLAYDTAGNVAAYCGLGPTTFTCTELDTGRYTVEFVGGERNPTWMGPELENVRSAPVDVIDGQVTSGVALSPVLTRRITGRISGSLRLTTVFAHGDDGWYRGSIDSNTGDYVIPGLAPGSYDVVFNVGTLGWQYSWPGTPAWQVYPQGPVLVPNTASAVVAGVNTVTQPGATIVGQVVTPGWYNSSADVAAIPDDGPPTLAHVDSDGRFELHGLAPSTYTLSLCLEGHGSIPVGHDFVHTCGGAFPEVFGGSVAVASQSVRVTVPAIGTYQASELAYNGPFLDVSLTQPFVRDIAWMSKCGITTGYPDHTFRPAGLVNRDAMAAFMYRLRGEPAHQPPAVSPFTDVAVTHPFYREISWLADQGISTGYLEPDGTRTYRPGQPVSRDAMAAFMYRLSAQPELAPVDWTGFTDVGVDHPFAPEISWLAQVRISNGWYDRETGTSSFRPSEPITRDAMAAFIHRFDEGGF